MANLEETLPNIVQIALENEDQVTKILATTLLRRVYLQPNSEKLKSIITTALDTEIDKCIAAGYIKETDYMESEDGF